MLTQQEQEQQSRMERKIDAISAEVTTLKLKQTSVDDFIQMLKDERKKIFGTFLGFVATVGGSLLVWWFTKK